MKKLTVVPVILLAAAITVIVATTPVFAVKDMRLLGVAESVALGTLSVGGAAIIDSAGSNPNTNGAMPGAIKAFARSFSKTKTFWLIALAKFINAVSYYMEFLVEEAGGAEAVPGLYFQSELVSDVGAVVWVVVFLSAAIATTQLLRRK